MRIYGRDGVPIFVMVLGSFLLLLIVPLTLYSYATYQEAGEKYQQEIHEKLGLLAKGLALPVHDYIDKHLSAIKLTADVIEQTDIKHKDTTLGLLRNTMRNYPSFSAIAVHRIPRAGTGTIALLARRNSDVILLPYTGPASGEAFDKYFDGPNPSVSGIRKSPFSGSPKILLRLVCRSTPTETVYLLAELDVSRIEALRAAITFGDKGHTVVVDHRGKVAAHPDPRWTAEMKDLSDWPIVRRALTGEAGVDGFFCPLLQQQMIAGFTAVPDYGWGVLVSQPKAEIESKVRSLVRRQLIWASLGGLAALFLAYKLARWITRPIRQLSAYAQSLDKRNDAVLQNDATDLFPPREVSSLRQSLFNAIAHQRRSREQIFYIAEHAPLLFLVCDHEGRISYAAGRLLSQFDWKPETVVGQVIAPFCGAGVTVEELLQRAKSEKEISYVLDHKGLVIEMTASAAFAPDSDICQFMFVGVDVSHSRVAAAHVQLLALNRLLLERALQAEETERKCLAGELHDLLGQDLTAIRNYSVIVRQAINAILSGKEANALERRRIRGYIENIENTTVGLQEIIRSMLVRLWPEALDDIGIIGALNDLVQDFQKQNPGIAVVSTLPARDFEMSGDRAIHLYRIVAEALTNVSRHAKATEVSIRAEKQGKGLVIAVSDNGEGFDPVRIDLTRHGIRGMQERARVIGGEIEIRSAPGEGTTISVRYTCPDQIVPMPPPGKDAH